MVPLVTCQRVLTWHCVCSADSTNISKKIIYFIFIVTIFIVNCSALTAILTFFVKSISIDLVQALYASFQVVPYSTAVYSIIVTLLLRYKINALFRQLSELYNTNKNEDSRRFFAEANRKSEKAWKIYFIFAVGTLIGTPMQCAVSVIFSWTMSGTFDEQFLYHPFKFILPWNQNTPIGYFGEVCCVVVSASAYYYSNSSILVLFVSMCLHHQAFYKIFQNSLTKLNQTKDDRNNARILRDLVQFHNSTKEWFMISAEVYNGFILFQLTCYTIMLAGVVFQFDLALKHINFSIILLLMVTVVGVANLFLWCYFGKLATESFEKMALCLYESNWPGLPIDLQKQFVIMIGNAQKLLFYHGYGFLTLNLQTFTSLVRTIITYYMMFKTVTSD